MFFASLVNRVSLWLGVLALMCHITRRYKCTQTRCAEAATRPRPAPRVGAAHILSGPTHHNYGQKAVHFSIKIRLPSLEKRLCVALGPG
jgi:hypothetical protein